MFPIGVQYYRAPTPLKDDWERDIKTAREYGLNIIRIWVLWSWYNPMENKYDFSEIEGLLNICSKHGMKAILLLNLESAPAWLVKAHPEAIYVSNLDKKYYPDPIGNTAAGGFPGLCFDHEVVRHYGGEFITRIVSAFKDHEALHCWEPHNEPLIEPSRYNPEIYCYCEKTIERFRRWLRNKYNSIDELNYRWKRRYSDFDEVFPPRKKSTYPDWVDWRMFAINSLIEMDRWRIELIRKNDNKHFIMSHSRGGSGFSQNVAIEGTDDWGIAKDVDKYGVASFGQHVSIADATSFGIDIVRNASKGKEYWLSELLAFSYGMGLYRDSSDPECYFCGSTTREKPRHTSPSLYPGFKIDRVTPERIKLWTWVGISMGCKGVLYWQYRMERFGLEYGFGLTDLDGSPTERLEAVKEISSIIENNEEFFAKAKPYPAEIAIACTPINYIISTVAMGCAHPVIYSLKGIYKCLWDGDYPVDFVRLDEEFTDDVYDNYKIIYLPFPIWLSPKSARKLEKFVHNGGIVVSEASLAQYDEELLASTTVPGLGLDKLFGCRREYITSVPRIELEYEGTKITSCFYQEIVKPTAATAKVVGKFYDGTSAAIINRYGEGEAIYIGSNPFMFYMVAPNVELLELVKRINRRIYRPAYTDSASVRVRTLVYDNIKLIFVLNTQEKATYAKVIFSGRGRLVDFISKRALEDKDIVEMSGGTMAVDVDLKGYEVKIYIWEEGG